MKEQLKEQLKENIGHKCQVVPFNTIEWVNGYITGLTEDKRHGTTSYIIKTEDGRRLTKTIESQLLRILDEKIDLPKKTEKTEETLQTDLQTGYSNVGKLVDINNEQGRIISITVDKRVNAVMYKININGKLIHKMVTANLNISEDFDEEGLKINTKFLERRDNIVNRVTLTPEEKVQHLEKELEKSLERLERLKEDVEKRKKQLEELKSTL